MGLKSIVILIVVFACSFNLFADPGKQKPLPPGLEKNLERGKPLPPGLEKKLAVGEVLDRDIYRRGQIVVREGGFVTIRVEGKLIRLVENTLEIVDILDSM